jgi:hypothetical protein
MFGIVVTSSDEERRAWLAEVAGTIDSHFPKGAA